MVDKLKELYGNRATLLEKEINRLIEVYSPLIKNNQSTRVLTQEDSILISYGDSIIKKGESPLKTLATFLDQHVGDAISGLHILPFYPYTSDDGFSVLDYLQVDEALGSWEDIESLKGHYDLMFDAVINHISSQSQWYEGYKSGSMKYKDFFIECDPKEDYTQVVRPRALPLLTKAVVEGEEKYVWTTFSEDQIDLNYKNPQVFLEILKVLLTYMVNGARYIRLDAIGFAWKEIGTRCIHLAQTHILIQLMRQILQSVNPEIVIITETNVPHKENISYFGDGYNEAHMVYQFPLPPLTMYTFLSGDVKPLMAWAKDLELISDKTTYFNFLASHDGIGLRPVENMLDSKQIQVMIDSVLRNGGRINYKNNSDGTQSPYELNINYMEGLKIEGDDLDDQCKRFIAAQSLLYTMVGVPGVYIHSLLGSTNDIEGMSVSGINRRINREKLDFDRLVDEILVKERRRSVFEANKKMLELRSKESAFNPYGAMEVVNVHKNVVSFIRRSLDKSSSVMVLINASNIDVEVDYCLNGSDILTGNKVNGARTLLKAYEVKWIKQS